VLNFFQQDKFYDVSYDTGDMSVQCGRKVDAFKAWSEFREFPFRTKKFSDIF
jgi:hypothetical protein